MCERYCQIFREQNTAYKYGEYSFTHGRWWAHDTYSYAHILIVADLIKRN